MADEIDDDVSMAKYSRFFIIGGVVLLTMFIIYKATPRSTFAADGMSPRWDATAEQSRAAHLPVLVLFTADWCPTCNALHQDTLSSPEVISEINGHYLMVTVDLTSQSALCCARARRYGVSGIPAMIRFDADGKETDRVHYLPPERMVSWLREGEAAN